MTFARYIWFAVFMILASASNVHAVMGQMNGIPEDASRNELEAHIKARSDELEKVNEEILAVQKELLTTQTEKKTLQSELNLLRRTASQLELSVRSDEISIKKLNLEVKSLTFDIQDIESSLKTKKEAIAEIFRQIHKSSQANVLLTFLKSESFADGVLEAQSLGGLNARLAEDMGTLRILRDKLEFDIDAVSAKKAKTSLHYESLLTRKSIVQDQKGAKQSLLSETQNKESLYQKQISELEKQQLAISDELAAIENELRKRFDVSLLPSKRAGALLWPAQLIEHGGKGIITQHFGEISYLYRGRAHNGLDIGVPLGTPISAADDGVVFAVDNNDRSTWSKYQYGKYVLIKHLSGFASLYAHLSRQSVSVGQEVKRGDVIGYSGATGYSTGPHIHFGLYWGASLFLKSIPPAAGLVPVGVIINPEDYL